MEEKPLNLRFHCCQDRSLSRAPLLKCGEQGMEMLLEKQGFNVIEHSCPACNFLYTGAKTLELTRVNWHDPHISHAVYLKLTSLVKHEMRHRIPDNCGTPD